LEEYKNESEKEAEKLKKEKADVLSRLEEYKNKSEKEAEKLKKEKADVLSQLKEYKDKYEKVSKKYLSLKNSKLGKFTLRYWSFLNKVKNN
ncbi:FkbM family methyltransferase, partial [Bacillus pseudomycoides]